jgi:hypothetical protein
MRAAHLLDSASSRRKPPPSATVTRCCTSTSSGASGLLRASTRPASAASRAAAASTSSSVFVGTRVMRLGRPGAWPERPARCSSRATPLAEPICSTRSTGRKSTPRSSEEVATTALSAPAFSPASTHSRTEGSSEPWCSAISPAQSGRAASSSWYQISACERVLVKTSAGGGLRSISPPPGAASARPGARPRRSAGVGRQQGVDDQLLGHPAAHQAPGALRPSSVAIASSRLPSVADTPHTTSCGFQRCSRASASCTCTPRLLPISSCHSSPPPCARRPAPPGRVRG